jgi:hypothetical protein
MARIVLSDADLDDIAQGQTVTVKTEDGGEQVLDGQQLSTADLSALSSGEPVWIKENRLICKS